MNSFAVDVQRFAQLSNTRINTLLRRVISGILRGVVRKSPVDTGRFRANWQLGVDSRPSGVIASTENNAISNALPVMPAQPAGHVYYIVNNLPYAQALEDGHSTQSPPGNMVSGTVAEFQQIIREALQ